jgi:ABC-type spermidine/putrescine transport system permease subunit II
MCVRTILGTALSLMAVHLSFRGLRHVHRLAASAGCLHTVVSSPMVAFTARFGVPDTKLLLLLASFRFCSPFGEFEVDTEVKGVSLSLQ